MKFEEILKGIEVEGKEKHLPVIEVGKGRGKSDVDVVRVFVGKEVPHPNTVEHHIAWIELVGDFKAFCALSYCNVHGVWQNCVEL